MHIKFTAFYGILVLYNNYKIKHLFAMLQVICLLIYVATYLVDLPPTGLFVHNITKIFSLLSMHAFCMTYTACIPRI